MLSIPNLKDAYGSRDRVILELFYGTGIRTKELLNLEIHNFLIEERLIFVRQWKGRKDRIIPIGEHTFKYLKKYVKEIRGKILKKKMQVFICYRKWNKNKLSSIRYNNEKDSKTNK